MKKNSSLLLSGLLVSGMVLGTVVPSVIVKADANTTTQAATNVTNNVSYYDKATNQRVATRVLRAAQGSEISYTPDGFTFVGNKPLMGADMANINVNVTKMISVKVNYVDQNNQIVNSETVNGGNGETYKLTNLPAGCSWNNDSEQTITLNQGQEYNIPVTRKVENTVIFKTADETEVGRAQIFGDKVGDSINLTATELPSGYTSTTTALNLQSDKNTQFVTVTKSADSNADTSTNGVVTVNNKTAQLYSIYGTAITGRTLDANTDWQMFETKTIKGATYYRVASNEWVKASDVTVKTSDVTTPFKGVVTTKGEAVNLVTRDGKSIKGRALGPNTAWKAFHTMIFNGKTYYQVSTNEWADGSMMTIKASEDTTVNKDVTITSYKSTVTTTNSVALLYTKGGIQIKGRALKPSTAWKTANKMVLDNETYYQVATNEWVKSTSLVDQY